jgi:signal transduction histidine kinase
VAVSDPNPADAASTRRAPAPAVLWACAIGGVSAAVLSFAFALSNDVIEAELGEPLVVAILVSSITASYVVCGVVAWWRRPASRFGPLMIAVGYANFLTTLVWTPNDVLHTLGQSLDLLPPVLFLHAFLAFPSGRLRGRFDRTIVGIAYAAAVGLELVRMMLGGFGPQNLLEITSRPAAAEHATTIQFVVVSACCVAGVVVLGVRRRREGRPLRRSLSLLIDAFALGLLMIAVLFMSNVLGIGPLLQIRWATFVTLALAPVVFLAGLLHDRLLRAGVGDLFLELRDEPGLGDLRLALARALHDPSLELAYWLPAFGCYAAFDGSPVEVPDEGSARAVTVIRDRGGARVAALIHDPALRDAPELLDAVSAAAEIALENRRLQAELQARLMELRGSRARVFEAGRKERQRLERNLHDGAQQRLIALSLELGVLETSLESRSASRALGHARGEIATSLEELREIARGLHPAVVTGHGLEVALEQLSANAPIPVRLSVRLDGRLPDSLEVAAYYVVSECLANVARYASATTASVDVGLQNDDVVVEIVDNGVGGADTERGTGLRGLADRVEALDGRLRIWSPAGGGTRVRAEIPCAR